MPFVQHKLPCPIDGCNSSDGYHIDEDGKGYCFSCSGSTFPNNPQNGDYKTQKEAVLVDISYIQDYPTAAMPERGITEDIARKYGVKVECNESTGLPDKYFFPYYKKGEIVGYKVRSVTDKSIMYSVGNLQSAELFGSHVAREAGQLVIVTEGEMDTLAAYQMLKESGKNYNVVSLPSGANVKGITDNSEFLEAFDTVMLNFDMDKAGQECTQGAIEALSLGKTKIVSLPVKDANELLQSSEHRNIEYLQAINSAKTVRPDGIISGEDTWERIEGRETVESLPYPSDWVMMNKQTYGIRLGELDTWTSGSGMGKTQVLRELQYHILNTSDDSLGIIALEEPLEDTVEAMMALHLNKRISLPDVRETVTVEERHAAWLATSGTNRIHYYDHFGSTDDNNLLAKIRYMNKALGCNRFILDHLSIMVSEFASEGNERERIDTLMTKLKKITQELNIWIGMIVHLRKTSDKGKSFEEGTVPTLDDLRGSGSLKQLSNNVYALSRNQQDEDIIQKNTSLLTVLKCRLTGRNGAADRLFFNQDTGRMTNILNISALGLHGKDAEF